MTSAAVHQFDSALVRTPGRSVVEGLRAHGGAGPSYEGVLAEHQAYVQALRAAGLAVTVLPALEAFPDAIFVEDPALVFTEGAVLLRPGAASRAGEVEHLAPALRDQFDTVLELDSAGHADGGDIMVTPDRVFIGLSARTDEAGAAALARALERLGKASQIVRTPPGVLHFKSDSSLVDEDTVLTTSRLSASGVFDGLRRIITAEGEEGAANALRLNDHLLVSDAFPRTAERLDAAGFHVIPMKTAEVAKIDAGLSCMSLRWRRG